MVLGGDFFHAYSCVSQTNWEDQILQPLLLMLPCCFHERELFFVVPDLVHLKVSLRLIRTVKILPVWCKLKYKQARIAFSNLNLRKILI